MGRYLNVSSTIELFSLLIDDISMDDIHSIISANNSYMVIVTPNIQHVIDVNADDQILECYQSANLTICDSKIFQLLSGCLGNRISHVTAGSDLTEYMFSEYFSGEETVMVVGSSEADVNLLRKKYTLSNLVHYAPEMGFIDSKSAVQATVDEIMSVRPQFLFLAVGFPRQEILSCVLREKVDFSCTVFCIGASIDFLTGRQLRAPVFWRSLKLEWLFRFLMQPKRLFKRYFWDSWALFPLLFRELYKKFNKSV